MEEEMPFFFRSLLVIGLPCKLYAARRF